MCPLNQGAHLLFLILLNIRLAARTAGTVPAAAVPVFHGISDSKRNEYGNHSQNNIICNLHKSFIPFLTENQRADVINHESYNPRNTALIKHHCKCAFNTVHLAFYRRDGCNAWRIKQYKSKE